MRQAGATPHRGARASHRLSLSRCGAQAPDAQAQQLWPTGPAAPRHMGSSQTRAQTRVPCTSRQTPNHCATREALKWLILCYVNFTLIKKKFDQKKTPKRTNNVCYLAFVPNGSSLRGEEGKIDHKLVTVDWGLLPYSFMAYV